MCFADYVLYKGTNYYKISSAETIEIFYNIRTDLDKLQYASLITKIISDVTTENQNTYKILQLFLNTLYVISETEKNLDFILSVFKLRLLSIIGFAPNITYCSNCKTKENLEYFSVKTDSLKCSICGKQDTSAIQITEGTKLALTYILKSEPKKLYSFNVTQSIQKELEIISKIYTTEKLEKEYSN